MRKFYLLLLAAIAMTSLGSRAATDESTCLTLNFTDGNVVKFALGEKPVMTFSDSNFTVSSDGTDYTYACSTLSDFNFTKGHSSGILSVAADNECHITILPHSSVAISAQRLTAVSVFDLNGRHIMTVEAADGAAVIDLSDKPSGVYILEIPGYKSLKISK